MAEELLRLREFAAGLNVSLGCVRDWVRTGKVSTVKLSPRALRIPLSERDRLISQGYQPGFHEMDGAVDAATIARRRFLPERPG